MVLHEVSMLVQRGSVVSMIGANGAGKTTTLNVISGVVPIMAGDLLLDGEILRPSVSVMVRRGVAHCPEGRRMFPHMTVRENLATGAYIQHERKQLSSGLDEVFTMFPILADRSEQKAGTLSGGEQQMAAIGRALMSRPRLLLLDEPTLGLSPKLVQTVAAMIARIAQRGIAIVLVEQNANMALELADRGYVLESGRVVLEGEAAALRNDPRVREAYLSTV